MGAFTRFLNKIPAKYFRIGLNCWPPLLGAAIKVTYIAPDFKHIKAQMKLHWYNCNYVGVHYGGSMFSMTDSFYMLMLQKNFSSDYIIWDKAASIDFKKPGRTTLFAEFIFTDEELQAIKDKAANHEKYLFDKTVDLKDTNGDIIATVVRTLYVRLKDEADSV